MWISKKKWQEMEKKITALEKEQLKVVEMMQANIDSNENLLDHIKTLKQELEILETVNTDIAK